MFFAQQYIYTSRTINQVNLLYYDCFHISLWTLHLSFHILKVIKSILINYQCNILREQQPINIHPSKYI